MEWVLTLLASPFVWGLGLGLLVAFFVWQKNWQLRSELTRQKRFLSEKLELEAENWGSLKAELEKFREENERLRIKIADGGRVPGMKLRRELEIYARAQSHMTLSAPGFAAAWELAKRKAEEELSAEDQGKKPGLSMIGRLLGMSHREALPSAASEGREDDAQTDIQTRG